MKTTVFLEKYLLKYRERKILEDQLSTLENKHLQEKQSLIYKLQSAQREEEKLLIELNQHECGESKEGHNFVDTSGTNSRTGRDEDSETCTKCGFER